MTLLAAPIALVLLAIAALHAYWGFGGVWPGRDAADCARRVGGARRAAHARAGPQLRGRRSARRRVAGHAVSRELIDLPIPAGLVFLVAIAAALVFLGRGIAGFTPAWRRLTPEQPFATLDVRYYSPLCLAIGAGIAILAVQGLTA